MAIYSAHKPNMLLGYNLIDVGENLGLITFGCGATSKFNSSLKTAILLCGGLSPLIYLFARVCII